MYYKDFFKKDKRSMSLSNQSKVNKVKNEREYKKVEGFMKYKVKNLKVKRVDREILPEENDLLTGKRYILKYAQDFIILIYLNIDNQNIIVNLFNKEINQVINSRSFNFNIPTFKLTNTAQKIFNSADIIEDQANESFCLTFEESIDQEEKEITYGDKEINAVKYLQKWLLRQCLRDLFWFEQF